MAYSASSKEGLIGGMDEFLDNSLVLPPGDWGEDLLLPALHERHNLRRQKGGCAREMGCDYQEAYS